jgi:hypothetical protein
MKPVCSILLMLCFFCQPFQRAFSSGDSAGGIASSATAITAPQSGTRGIPPSLPSTARALPPNFFSMTVQSGVFKGSPWPSMAVGGIRLWDTFTNWNDIEPSRGTYDWPALDRWLALAQTHGVDVLYTFGGTPTWASENPVAKCDYNPGACYPPFDMQDWDDYVRALANHAAGRIKYWELWNEASQHEYWSGGMTALVRMAQHAHAIIKSVDPSAEIFTPSGVGGAAETSSFLDQFFSAGGGQFVDGVAFHGYGNDRPSSPEEINRIVDAVRGVMVKWERGDRPLWDTEASWGPADHLPNEDDRIAFVARHYILQWSKGVQRSYWYAWNDTSYGTLWDVGVRKIRGAGIAYGEVEKWLRGAVMTAPCVVTPESTWTCGLTLSSRTRAQIIWNSAAANSREVSFHPAPEFVQYRSLEGVVTLISGGIIQIGNKPLLLFAGAPNSDPSSVGKSY